VFKYLSKLPVEKKLSMVPKIYDLCILVLNSLNTKVEFSQTRMVLEKIDNLLSHVVQDLP